MKKRALFPFLAVCAAIAFSGCSSNETVQASSQVSSEVQIDPNSVAVETYIVEKTDISELSMFTGVVTPSETVNVVSPRTGVKVTAVNFDVGDSVKKGDVLFNLDTSDIQNSISVLEASIASADAGIQSAQTALSQVEGSEMQKQIESLKNAVSDAERELKNCEASLNTAKRDFESGQALFNAGAMAKTEFENLKTAYDTADRTYQAAQDALDTANYNYNLLTTKTIEENRQVAEDNLNSAIAQKNSQTAQMRSYQKDLTDSNVTSPINGVVLERNVTEGSMLGAETPFVIINIDTVKIEINVSEEMINSIHVGDPVQIKISSYSDKVFEGSISTIAPGSNSDGTFPVTIDIQNPGGEIKSGMFAQVNFVKSQSADTIVVDRAAVLVDTSGEYVYINDNGTAKKIYIETGIDSGDKIQVLSGIEEGMEVVINGNSYLNDGDSLRVVTGDGELKDSTPELNGDMSKSEGAE